MKLTKLQQVAVGLALILLAVVIAYFAILKNDRNSIQATIAYNKISTDLGRYSVRLNAFATEFSAIISRQLEAGE